METSKSSETSRDPLSEKKRTLQNRTIPGVSKTISGETTREMENGGENESLRASETDGDVGGLYEGLL